MTVSPQDVGNGVANGATRNLLHFGRKARNSAVTLIEAVPGEQNGSHSIKPILFARRRPCAGPPRRVAVGVRLFRQEVTTP